MRLAFRSISAVFVVLLIGCGGSTSPYGEADGTTDGTTDTLGDWPMDGIPDGFSDAIPDPTVDGSPDVPPDMIPDPSVDGGPDVPPDMIPDPSMDVPPDSGPTGIVGSACSSDASCTGVPSPEATCMRDFMGYVDLPGGYCSAPCTSDTECGPLGECVSFFGAGDYCLRSCVAPGDCRTAEGYSCSELPGGLGGPYCIPPFGGDDAGADY